MAADVIFEPLRFRNLEVKNRILRSNISGRFDNYDGSGTQARINWEEKFARGGVGAIVSSYSPVHVRGRILPNYATIDRDERIPFWRRVGDAVHRHDCKFILQLSHSGRQQDVGGVENLGLKALSSTSKTEPFHGFECRAMTLEEIAETIDCFAEGARRAREAGLDGVELHAANGYLITQFLSSGINDRKDQYGGALENRARFLLDIVRAIRARVGDDFHLQVKISAVDYNNAVIFWDKRGNTLEDSIQVCRWLEEAGADALHVSTGSMFPHPRNPAGGLPVDVARETYDTMLSSGLYTFRNYLLARWAPLRPIFRFLWTRTVRNLTIEAANADDAREIKRNVSIPVLCTGGFQTASVIRRVIEEGYCDAVTIARPLIANNDLVQTFAAGHDRPERPCTYCNRCLVNVIENPLGCYEPLRYGGDRERMLREVMSVYQPTGFE
ncbi:MAG: NADH:flavin oxidoreductase [Actinomycetota bacterium]|nr:NADH:flavin oxidoreductase [Actinomycetota bacterium]